MVLFQDVKIKMVEIYLTAKQKQVYEMYVLQGMNQEAISLAIYGNKTRMGDVSLILKAISKKVGINLSKVYRKPRGQTPFEIDLKKLMRDAGLNRAK